MSQSRTDRQISPGMATAVTAEFLRQGSESGKAKGDGKEEAAIPLFWRIFGGTVLSISALVMLNVYQGLSGNISGLRGDMSQLSTDVHREINRLNEMQADLVQREELEFRMRSVWRNVKELQDDRKDLNTIKEHCRELAQGMKTASGGRQQIQQDLDAIRQQQAAEKERQVLRQELVRLRERLAGLEGRRASQRDARPVHDHR